MEVKGVLLRMMNRAFETGVGIFVIVNGILTFLPQSSVRQGLENVVGYGSVAVPVLQILSGSFKLFGIGANKGNVEAAGLIMVGSMFAVRIFMLCSDGIITAQDINSITIAVLIIACNIVRLSQIIRNVQTLQFIGEKQ